MLIYVSISESQCALRIATFISKVLEHNQLLIFHMYYVKMLYIWCHKSYCIYLPHDFMRRFAMALRQGGFSTKIHRGSLHHDHGSIFSLINEISRFGIRMQHRVSRLGSPLSVSLDQGFLYQGSLCCPESLIWSAKECEMVWCEGPLPFILQWVLTETETRDRDRDREFCR